MGIAGNGAVLASPAAPPRTGLIASARELKRLEESTTTDGTRWENGFAWEPENYCSGNGVADPCANATAKTVDSNRAVQTHDPVALWAADKCSTLDRTRDRTGRVRRRLLACQSKLLAGELWNGTGAIAFGFDDNKYLASPDSNVVSDGALAEVNALACLEEALAACSCGRAMIHATPGLMTHWRASNLVERMGNLFVTANDTIVVADAGYTGDGPDGRPAVEGSVWAYGTDLVEVRLGAIDTWPRENDSAEGMDLSPAPDNLLTYRAERLAAATWDGCCHVAVEVDVNVCEDLAAS